MTLVRGILHGFAGCTGLLKCVRMFWRGLATKNIKIHERNLGDLAVECWLLDIELIRYCRIFRKQNGESYERQEKQNIDS